MASTELILSSCSPLGHRPQDSHITPHDTPHDFCSLSSHFPAYLLPHQRGSSHFPPHARTTWPTWWDVTQVGQSEFSSNTGIGSGREKPAPTSGMKLCKHQLSWSCCRPAFPPDRQSPLVNEVNTERNKGNFFHVHSNL